MKKVIALMLALIMCMCLFACGKEESKYVGTYSNDGKMSTGFDGFSVVKEMIISADGTGTATLTATDDYIDKNVKRGDVLWTIDFTWQEVEGFLATNGTKVMYYRPDSITEEWAWLSEPTSDAFVETYELKGNQLFEVGRDYASYNKEMD